MIDQLITALSKEIEMSAEEIADTIWLALQMQEFHAESVSSGLSRKTEKERGNKNEKIKPEQETSQKPEPKSSDLEETSIQPSKEQKAGLYPQSRQENSNSSDLSFKVPDALSLREPLNLARALKPFW
ncbi:hypothetical protein [Gloeothece verrucosa]|uniref:Uncharacterized protein n=1 Tax=Gloeothece verrucosa (strain PCC 7822) TaxID=497965 RepID=E0UD35_GLOV7|nr:hypothetical protein [Gloeothece verrucosa]ADN12915.1 conserved hypothetical protein [Gloeothece verrucosa PCC 7822]